MQSFYILFLFLVSVPFLGVASNTASSYFCTPRFDLYEPNESTTWEMYLPQDIKWNSFCIYDDYKMGDFTVVDCDTYQFVTPMENNLLMEDGQFSWRPFGIMPDVYRVRLDTDDDGIFYSECFELVVRKGPLKYDV